MKKSVKSLPAYSKTSQTKSGANSLTPDKKVSRDGTKGALDGKANARYQKVSPTSSSGTIGGALPLKTNSGGKDARLTNKARPVINTKPKRK